MATRFARNRSNVGYRIGLLMAGILPFMAFVVAAPPAHGQAYSGAYGEWTFGVDAGLAAASTTNAQGESLGMVCGPNCLNYVESARPCVEGNVYDGTIESTIGTFPVRLTCHHLEGRYVLTSVPTEDFIRILSECVELRFVVRLEDYEVFGFSLNGGYDAIYAVLEAASSMQEPARTNGDE